MSTDSALKSKGIFNYLWEKANNEGISLSPMKAIKLVYFAHAWYLGFEKKPLLTESIEAWKYGAVIPSLYDSLKIYGGGKIAYPIFKDSKYNKYFWDIIVQKPLNISDGDLKKDMISYSLDSREEEIINAVWNVYKNKTAIELSNIMHQPGTPWSEIWKDGNCPDHAVIPNELIQNYYVQKIERIKNSESMQKDPE